MTYKEVIEKTIKEEKEILDSLCDARDTYKNKTTGSLFFQSLVEAVAVLKNQLEQDYFSARIDEAESN